MKQASEILKERLAKKGATVNSYNWSAALAYEELHLTAKKIEHMNLNSCLLAILPAFHLLVVQDECKASDHCDINSRQLQNG